MLTHRCGQCDKSFKTEEEYFHHVCPVSGYTPKESGNLTVIYQSKPPKIKKRASIKISESDLVKAVTQARKMKRV